MEFHQVYWFQYAAAWILCLLICFAPNCTTSTSVFCIRNNLERAKYSVFKTLKQKKKQFPLFYFFAEVYQYIDCIVNLFSGKDFPSDCITDRAGNQAEEARIRISNLFVFVFAIRQKKQGLGFLNFWFYLQSGRVSPDTNF